MEQKPTIRALLITGPACYEHKKSNILLRLKKKGIEVSVNRNWLDVVIKILKHQNRNEVFNLFIFVGFDNDLILKAMAEIRIYNKDAIILNDSELPDVQDSRLISFMDSTTRFDFALYKALKIIDPKKF